MNIEQEIFQKAIVDFQLLINYGFIKVDNSYHYSTIILDNLDVEVMVNEQGLVTANIYDPSSNSEYTNYRIESQTGPFVSAVRSEYRRILEQIRDKCCIISYFSFPQANRITDMIIREYQTKPEFMWDKFPEYGIFRNADTKKWYALIMNIDANKIKKDDSSMVDVINVKLGEERVTDLLKENGFYEAYHMNKKNWITIILDDTLSDEEIMKCVMISNQYSKKGK